MSKKGHLYGPGGDVGIKPISKEQERIAERKKRAAPEFSIATLIEGFATNPYSLYSPNRFAGVYPIVGSEYQMDHFAVTEEQIATQRLRQKLDEVNEAAQTHLAPIQDHVNFTLQGIVCPLDMGLIPFGILRLSLPKAYFKCAHECFDRSRRQEEITNCVENCSVPLSRVQTFESEMAQLQPHCLNPSEAAPVFCPSSMGRQPHQLHFERLHRSLMVCQDKYEAAKLQQKPGAVNDLLSCADLSIQEGIKMLPLLTNKFKASFGIRDNSPS
ncbi:hypothetical protein RIF29_25437 [Crotalaria pallida]|uniref:Uncharacterized protein n=1 Tax=Crotalaria pallida TaxID=3830 RepID=A0AAN9HZA6_CROPI